MLILKLTRTVRGLGPAGAYIVAKRLRPTRGNFVVYLNEKRARIVRWREGMMKGDATVTNALRP